MDKWRGRRFQIVLDRREYSRRPQTVPGGGLALPLASVAEGNGAPHPAPQNAWNALAGMLRSKMNSQGGASRTASDSSHEIFNELSKPVKRRQLSCRGWALQMTLDLAETGGADAVQRQNSISVIFLLIDFENVSDVPLASLAAEYRVFIFVGRSQNSIPFNLTRDAQQLGTRLEWIKIEGDGRNNLDFHLAYYLGVLTTEHKDAEFLILSRDKGFDPVIRHVVGRGSRRTRIETLSQMATVIVPKTDDPYFEKAFKVVAGIDKKSRPRKRKTLLAHLASISHKKRTDVEVQRIVDVFFAKNLISESDNALTYHF
jgi:hypothetical protein